MGAKYYLVNHDKKEIFELGKGIWTTFIGNEEYLLYKEGIDQIFEEEIFDDKSLTPENIDYWHQVSDQIWKFVQNINHDSLEIINDCTDSLYFLKCQKYKIIESRYEDCNLKDLNRHLDPELAQFYQLKGN